MIRTRIGIFVGLVLLPALCAFAAKPDSPPRQEKPPIATKRVDLYGEPLPTGCVARLGTLRFRQGSAILAVAVSPDCRTILSAGRDGVVRVWEAATGRQLRQFTFSRLHESRVRSALFSADGTILLFGEGLGDLEKSRRPRMWYKLCLWNVAMGKPLCELSPVTRPFGLSPDGKHLAAASKKGSVCVWDTANGREVLQIKKRLADDDELHFSPDGRMVTIYSSQVLEMHDVNTSRQVRRIPVHRDDLTITFANGRRQTFWNLAPDRRRGPFMQPGLAMLSVDGRTRVIATGTTVRMLPAGEGGAAKPAVNARTFELGHDRTLLLEGILKVIDITTGKPIHRVVCKPDEVGGPMACAANGKFAASIGGNSEALLWDIAGGKRLRRLPDAGVPINAIAFSADGRFLVAGGDAPFLPVWNVEPGKLTGPAQAHLGGITALHYAADGKTLRSASRDGTVRTWDLSTARELRQLRIPNSPNVRFSPDGKTVACGDYHKKKIRLLDAIRGTERPGVAWLAPSRRSNPYAFLPNGKQLLTRGNMDDGSVVLWDLGCRKPIRQFVQPDTDYVNAVACSHDGVLLASVYEKDVRKRPATFTELVIWEAATGKKQRVIPITTDFDHDEPPLAFSPDSRTIVLAYGGLRVLETATGQWRRTIGLSCSPMSWHVWAICFSPDGRLLAAAGDREVCFWDTMTGKVVGRFSGHRGTVRELAFSPDGKTLASGGDDTTVLIWDVATLLTRSSQQKKLAPKALRFLWTQLGQGTAADAMAQLAQAPTQAVALLRKHLPPVPTPQQAQVSRLLTDLQSPRFAVRQNATQQLAEFADAIEPELRKRQEAKAPLEVRQRIEQLLRRLRSDAPEQARQLRAVEVLEYLGSREARQLLETLANGAPQARLTHEARASLQRLRKHSVAP